MAPTRRDRGTLPVDPDVIHRQRRPGEVKLTAFFDRLNATPPKIANGTLSNMCHRPPKGKYQESTIKLLAKKLGMNWEDLLLKPRGTISTPVPRSRVDRRIAVAGTLAGLTSEQHAWLAVQVDGLYWPKVQVSDAAWQTHILEGGCPVEFSVCLVLVDDEEHARILAWMEAGSRTGHYPGIPGFARCTILHRVDSLALI